MCSVSVPAQQCKYLNGKVGHQRLQMCCEHMEVSDVMHMDEESYVKKCQTPNGGGRLWKRRTHEEVVCGGEAWSSNTEPHKDPDKSLRPLTICLT